MSEIEKVNKHNQQGKSMMRGKYAPPGEKDSFVCMTMGSAFIYQGVACIMVSCSAFPVALKNFKADKGE